MKIIDLLNKISKGEIPKTIVYDERYFTYDDKRQNYFAYDDSEIDWKYTIMEYINDEIEIIEDTPKEEKKIPEKIEIYEDSEGHYFIDKHCKNIYITCDEVNFMVEEFNQLIDYLKSKGE